MNSIKNALIFSIRVAIVYATVYALTLAYFQLKDKPLPAKAHIEGIIQREHISDLPEIVRLKHGCTGFIVAKDLIATAGHCVGMPLFKRVSVYFTDGTTERFRIVKRGLNWYGDDWALLEGPTGVRNSVELQDKPPEFPGYCFFTGHGGNNIIQHTLQCAYFYKKYDMEYSYYYLHSACEGGYSGSPVYDSATGKVFGLIVRVYMNIPVTLAIKIDNLKKAINEVLDGRNK